MEQRERRLFVTRAQPDEVPVDRFLPSLAAILGQGALLAQRVPFADAEQIVERAAGQLQSARAESVCHAWPPEERGAVTSFLERFALELTEPAGLYFCIRWPSLGALRVNPGAVLRKSPELAQGGFGALVASLDGSDGCRVDRAADGGLEVTVWGGRWAPAARTALAR